MKINNFIIFFTWARACFLLLILLYSQTPCQNIYYMASCSHPNLLFIEKQKIIKWSSLLKYHLHLFASHVRAIHIFCFINMHISGPLLITDETLCSSFSQITIPSLALLKLFTYIVFCPITFHYQVIHFHIFYIHEQR